MILNGTIRVEHGADHAEAQHHRGQGEVVASPSRLSL
jgi:hypothetical protein